MSEEKKEGGVSQAQGPEVVYRVGRGYGKGRIIEMNRAADTVRILTSAGAVITRSISRGLLFEGGRHERG